MPSSPSFNAGAAEAAGWPTAILRLAEQALPDFLMRQRWYPAKDAGTPTVALERLLPIPVPGAPAAAGIWSATPPGQAPIRMLVALARVAADAVPPSQVICAIPAQAQDAAGADERQVLAEAFAIDDFVRAWAGLMLREMEERPEPGADVRLVARRTAAAALPLDGTDTGAPLRVKRSSAEQSNTSIRLGDGMIMKAFRRLQDGTNPELEVGRFLTQEARFDATPALLGWVSLEPADGESGHPGDAGLARDDATTLAILQAFVPNEGDGWEWLQARLAEPSARGPPPAPPGAGPGGPPPAPRRLGGATGRWPRGGRGRATLPSTGCAGWAGAPRRCTVPSASTRTILPSGQSRSRMRTFRPGPTSCGTWPAVRWTAWRRGTRRCPPRPVASPPSCVPAPPSWKRRSTCCFRPTACPSFTRRATTATSTSARCWWPTATR